MGIRDWLAIIVIIFIVLILLDGFRRKWLERKNRIVVKLDKNIPPVAGDDPADPLTKSELPNGGARTINRSNSTLKSEAAEIDVPVLMESVDLTDDDIEEYASDNESEVEAQDQWDVQDDPDAAEEISELDQDLQHDSWDSEDEIDNNLDEDSHEDDDGYEASEWNDEDLDIEDDSASESPHQAQEKKGFLSGRDAQHERIEPSFGDQDLTFSRDDQGELELEHHDLFESEHDAEHDEEMDEDEEHEQAHEVIIINVMAKSETQIEGKDLLKILLKQGMRLGEMSIFHRHADTSGKGPVMFSMANMLKPGTFSMSEMEDFTTPGVSFFMQIPNNLGNMHCFDEMLSTAEALQNELDVLLKDEDRSVFTRQTIEHSRQRIRDFELEMLARK